MEDIANNQKLNIVGAIGPIRSISRVGGAFWGVLWRPIEGSMSLNAADHAGRRGEQAQGVLPDFDPAGLVRGMVQGVNELVFVLGEEGQNVRKKVWKVAGGTTDGVV